MSQRARLKLLWLLPLFAVSLHGQQSPQPPVGNTVDTGAINGAAFYIEIPRQWNKGLVLFAHGYTIVGRQVQGPNSPRVKAMRDVFLSRGFAFAASDYSVQGWAVKEAIEETEALRRYFTAKYGVPSETYITGHSIASDFLFLNEVRDIVGLVFALG